MVEMNKKPAVLIVTSFGWLVASLTTALAGGDVSSTTFGSKGNGMQMVAKRVAAFREDDDVSSLEFSPNDDELAVGTFVTLHINLWAWKASSKIVRTFLKPPVVLDYTSNDAIRYSPDGKWLAISHGRAPASDGRGVVRIFDASTGSVVRDFAEPLGGGIYSRVAFSAAEQLFLRSYDAASPPNRNQFIAYRTGTWEELWGLRIAPLNVISLAVSADGRFAALGGITLGPGVIHNAQILVIDLKERRIVRTIDNAFPAENSVKQVAWNPDGIHLAAGGIVGGTHAGFDAVRIFAVSTGELQTAERVPSGDVVALRYAPSGRYLVESGIGASIRIWDGSHKALLQEIPNTRNYAIAVSRDSRYLAVGDGAKVEVWEFL